MLRSILAVVSGIVVWGVLWVAANFGAAALMPSRFDQNGIPSDLGLLVFFILICAALCFLAGWICAAVAPRSPLKHVVGLGLIQLAIGVFVQSGVWELMPLWYHVVFLAIVVPMHLVGGGVRVAGACVAPGLGRLVTGTEA